MSSNKKQKIRSLCFDTVDRHNNVYTNFKG